MHQLKPFKGNISNLYLSGDVQFKGHDLVITFRLEDPDDFIKGGFKELITHQKPIRANELWKETCFEAFWSEPESQKYWEFNYSTSGKWNLYFFEEYRSPSPPKESSDFEFKSVNLEGNILSLRLQSEKIYQNIEASLCAVIKTKKEEVYYFSTIHQGEKADFHLRSSLSLLVKNK